MNVSSFIPSGSTLSSGAKAVGRHLVSITAGAAVASAGFAVLATQGHVLTTDQASTLVNAFKALASGVDTTVGAISTIAGIAMTVWAASTTRNTSQVAAVAAVPGQQVIADPKVVAAVPSPDVLSNAEHVIVPKV